MLAFDNITLRAVTKKDSSFLHDVINSPDLVRFNTPYRPIDEVNHIEWLTNVMKDRSKEYFIIELDNKPIGTIQLIDIDLTHRNAELTIRISNQNLWGKGIGSKAVDVLCQHAFLDLGLIRVWLRVFSPNERAISAYQKVGFEVEGTMRKAAFINGDFVDVVVMGRLNDKI